MTLDPIQLAMLRRDQPLLIHSTNSPFTCAICGATQEPHANRVTLGWLSGKACPPCAEDHGWTTQ